MTIDYGTVDSAEYGRITLMEQATATNRGTDGDVIYTARGHGIRDGERVDVRVEWVPTEAGLARAHDGDESDVCDWDSPVRITEC